MEIKVRIFEFVVISIPIYAADTRTEMARKIQMQENLEIKALEKIIGITSMGHGRLDHLRQQFNLKPV